MKKTFRSLNIPLKVQLEQGVTVRYFSYEDFPAVQSLYESEGWLTPIKRPDDAIKAWENSSIALVAVKDEKIVGLVRALTDTEITTYIAELLVSKEYRGKGLGRSLIDICHHLYPRTRIDLLSTESADEFYKSNGFKAMTGFRKSYY